MTLRFSGPDIYADTGAHAVEVTRIIRLILLSPAVTFAEGVVIAYLWPTVTAGDVQTPEARAIIGEP